MNFLISGLKLFQNTFPINLKEEILNFGKAEIFRRFLSMINEGL